MVLGTCRRFQVQGVNGDARVAGFDPYLLGVQPGPGQLVIAIQSAGIGDQYHIARTEWAPVDLVDGLHDTGVGVFIEALARHFGLFQVRGFGKEIRTVFYGVGVGIHLGHVFQPWHSLGTGTKCHQTELHLPPEIFLGNLRVYLADRFSGPFDVRIHGNSRVNHEHHRGTELFELAGSVCRGLALALSRSGLRLLSS